MTVHSRSMEQQQNTLSVTPSVVRTAKR